MDLEMADRALRASAMDLELEAPGRPGREAQLDRTLWPELRLEVVAVEMQREGSVARPPERDLVALPDPQEPLVFRQAAVLERELEDPRLGSSDSGGEHDGERGEHDEQRDEPGAERPRPAAPARHGVTPLTPRQFPPTCWIRAAAWLSAVATSGRSFSGR